MQSNPVSEESKAFDPNILLYEKESVANMKLTLNGIKETAAWEAAGIKLPSYSIEQVAEETKKADIVVVAIGKANYLKEKDIRVGSIIVDVGINFIDGKITGDVDFENIKGKVGAITPVPGGVGIVTNYCLVENILKKFEIQNK